MPAPFRRSRLALVLYALLAVAALWFAGSLIGNLSGGGAPVNPAARFSSQTELRQYFAVHPGEVAAFNRDVETWRQAQMAGIASPFANLGPHGQLVAVLADFWALLGVVYLALLAAGVVRRSMGRLLIGGGFALSFVLGRVLLGWLFPYLGMALTVLPEPFGFLAAFLLPPLLLWLGGLMVIVLVGGLIGVVFGVLVGMPVAIFNQIMQFEIAAQIFRHRRSGLVGYLVRLSYWMAGETMPLVPDDTRGARFAVPDEVTALQDRRGIAFGHVNGAPLLLYTEKHILIQASTRSGKGVALLLPHLLRYPGSVFCLDPKGENAKAAGRYRESVNDKTHYLDPFLISGKPPSRFNPLSYFTPENMEAASKALARAFVLSQSGGGDSDHWDLSAQQLLALAILYVFTEPDIPPEEKDLVLVRRMLLSATPEMLKTAQQSKVAGGLLADVAASFLQTPEREFGSILSHAQRNTEILDNPYIRACLSASGDGEEIDFADWRKGTMSVFLCLSAPKFPVFSRWLRMVLTAALDAMTDRLDPPPLPVAFVLDEVATLGHLEVLENAVGLAAGYGIQLIYVFQDTAQMTDLYKGRWASFISNAGVRALFNLDDYATAEYWSKTLGNRLVAGTSETQNIYGLTSGQTVKDEMRSLMPPEEIMLRFARDMMLVLPQGSPRHNGSGA